MDKRRLHRELLKQALFNAPRRQDLAQTITVEGISVKCDSDGPDGFTHWGKSFDNREKAMEHAKECLQEEKYKNYKLIII